MTPGNRTKTDPLAVPPHVDDAADEVQRRGPRETVEAVYEPISDLHREIGERTKQRRVALGWTSKELAAESGISRVTLSRVENGRHDASVGTLASIARALGVRLRDLLPTES